MHSNPLFDPELGSILYSKIEKLAPEVLNGEKSSVRYVCPSADDVVVEDIGGNFIAVSSYYMFNGDSMANPDMEFEVDYDHQLCRAVTFQQDNLYIFVNVDQIKSPEEKKSMSFSLNSMALSFLERVETLYERQGKPNRDEKEDTIR